MDNTFFNWCMDVKNLLMSNRMFTPLEQITEGAEWQEDFENGLTPEQAVEATLNIF